MKKVKKAKYVTTGTYQDGGYNWINTNTDIHGNTPTQPGRYVKDANGNLIDTITGEVIKLNNPVSQTQPQYKKTVTHEGELQLPDWLKNANMGIDFLTGLSKIVNNNNTNRKEQLKYLETIQPTSYRNKDEEGLNQIPTYFENGGNNWIAGAIKHPGRCHDMGGPDCPKGSPQYNLALTFKKHHGFHKAQNGAVYEPLIPTNISYVSNPGDTLTSNQIPQAARQQWEAYGIHGNPLKEQQIAILQMLNGSKRNDISGKKKAYKLSTKDQEKIDNFINNMGWWDKTLTAINPNQAYLPEASHKNGGEVSSEKAKEILRDGTAQGHPLTDKQKRYFGWIAGGKKQDGGFSMKPITAEAGEIYQDTNGGINKISDSSDTHDDSSGGVVVNNASKVLEDTGDKRKDIDSKLLLIRPDEMLSMTGIKVKKPLTHSKAFELVSKKAAKDTKYVEGYLKKNVKSIDQSSNDQYAKNSLDLNVNALHGVPTQNDIFQLLFNHQEQKKAQYNISDSGEDAQNGINNDIIYDAEGRTYNKSELLKKYTPQQLDALIAQKKYFKEERYGLGERADKFIRDNSQDPNGNFDNYDPTAKAPLPFGFNQYDKNHNYWNDLASYPTIPDNGFPYVDGDKVYVVYGNGTKKYVGDYRPGSEPSAPVSTTDGSQSTVDPSTMPRLPYNKPQDVRSAPGVSIPTIPQRRTLKNIKQPNNEFNAPLQWYDLLTPTTAFIDALQRKGVDYNGINLTTPKAKYLNAAPSLQQGITDYNTALQTLPSNGVGYANSANIFGKKYGIDINTLGNFENQNTGIWNANEGQVVGVKNAQAQADQQARQIFEQKQVAGIEAQRRQLLTSMGDITKTIADNAKYNREGNLLMKLFPAFNQEGNYNGYRYNFTNPNPFNTPVQPNPKKKKQS